MPNYPDSILVSAPARTPRRLNGTALYRECGRLLVGRGHITRGRLDDAIARAALLGKGLDEVLLAEHWVTEDLLLETLAEVTGIPHKTLAGFTLSPELAARAPIATALTYRIIPVAATGDTLTMATARLHEVTDHDSLQTLLRTKVNWVLCPRREIDEAIKHFYGLGADILADLGEQRVIGDAAASGIARWVEEIIREAIRRKASDIHLEPMEHRISLRFRIDGVLVNVPLPEGVMRHYKSIVSALKVRAQLNITEKRLPHDGRSRLTLDGETFDLRVSILPTQFGEAANLRILNRKTSLLSLQELGLMEHQRPVVSDLMSRPHGLVLITGPTGSGKTSTLYAALSAIRTEAISVVTIEDPVEYQMDGILQIQIQPDIGLTFAAGLRSVLRHDPNVILIGEIRDTETADIAIKSSLTGHRVFSTLHTNTSAGAVARLIDMGIEPYLVSSSVQGVIAQRLVRQVCPHCSESVEAPKPVLDEIHRLFPGLSAPPGFLRGRGCPACWFSGYVGRRAVFEILVLDPVIRSLVVNKATAEDIQHAATARGMETLRRNAWLAALQGLTTIEEVLRVTQA